MLFEQGLFQAETLYRTNPSTSSRITTIKEAEKEWLPNKLLEGLAKLPKCNFSFQLNILWCKNGWIFFITVTLMFEYCYNYFSSYLFYNYVVHCTWYFYVINVKLSHKICYVKRIFQNMFFLIECFSYFQLLTGFPPYRKTVFRFDTPAWIIFLI